jgi:hypothetical protein
MASLGDCAEKHRPADAASVMGTFTSHAAREEMFRTLQLDKTVEVAVVGSRYLRAVEQYLHGATHFEAVAAMFVKRQLHLRTVPSDAEVGEHFGVPLYEDADDEGEVMFIKDVQGIFRKWQSPDRAFDMMMALYDVTLDFCQRCTVNSDTIPVTRFIVVQSPGTTLTSDIDATLEGRCLEINDSNKAAAFYPTGWEDEVLTTNTTVRDIVSRKFLGLKVS